MAYTDGGRLSVIQKKTTLLKGAIFDTTTNLD